MADTPTRVMTIEIQGQRYPIRSALDAAYVTELATYVDSKIQAAAVQTQTADSLRVAVLAALNIADEFFRARDDDRDISSEILRRAAQLEHLIDEALSQEEA